MTDVDEPRSPYLEARLNTPEPQADAVTQLETSAGTNSEATPIPGPPALPPGPHRKAHHASEGRRRRGRPPSRHGATGHRPYEAGNRRADRPGQPRRPRSRPTLGRSTPSHRKPGAD